MSSTTRIPLPRLRGLLLLAASAVMLLFAGCRPEEYVLWAPDGQHALVKGNGGTLLIDANGAVLSKASDSEKWLDHPWMPDSRQLIVVREAKAKSFQEYKDLLGEKRTEEAYAAAPALLKVLQAYKGKPMENFDWLKPYAEAADRFKAAYSGETGLDPMPLLSACIVDRFPQEAADLARKQGEPAPEIAKLIPPIYELVIRNALPSEPATERVLLRTVDEISWVRSAPNGQSIAFVQLDPVRPGLYVISTAAGSSPVRVDEGAMEADWTPDGRTLVYAKTRLPYLMLKEEAHLGTITRRTLFDEAGHPLAEPGNAEDLAGILFYPEERVACLPDGRIVFASPEMILPAAGDRGGKVLLYALTVGETIKIEPLVTAEEVQARLPNRPDRFSLSPDGKRLALTSNAGGDVAVLSLDSRELETIQAKVVAWSGDNHSEFRPAPTWRSATELCYIAPAGHAATGSQRSEVVLHPLGGKPRAISRAWADNTGPFLRKD